MHSPRRSVACSQQLPSSSTWPPSSTAAWPPLQTPVPQCSASAATAMGCSRGSRVAPPPSGQRLLQSVLASRPTRGLACAAASSTAAPGATAAASAADPSSTSCSMLLPPRYLRLVARGTGSSFRDVAVVEEADLGLLVPGKGEVCVCVCVLSSKADLEGGGEGACMRAWGRGGGVHACVHGGGVC